MALSKLSKTTLSLSLALALTACQTLPTETNPATVSSQQSEATFQFAHADYLTIQDALAQGELSSAELITHYLRQIEANNQQGAQLRAVISLNPDALNQAKMLDNERKQGNVRGPLHGIPVLLKDNIDTADGLANTAGSVLFAENYPEDDATLVTNLRKQGAIILGKANLSEWANFRSTRSSSGWSGVGGLARNPYDPTRSTCGSSAGSGAAVAADFTTFAVGTETDGSLVCPGAVNGIVSIKPTLGLISRDGIIPISHSQDTAGPMARTVAGAVTLMQAMASYDGSDSASFRSDTVLTDYLNEDGLKGKRIGVVRNLMGYNELLDQQFEQQLDVLKAQGATLVDVEMPTYGEYGDAEFTVLLYEFKHDMAAYLATTNLPYRSMSDLIEANNRMADKELPYFGQELFIMANNMTAADESRYLDALEKSKRLAGPEGIDKMLTEHDLDLLVAPTTGPSWKIDLVNGDHYAGSASSPAAVAGYPHITVPMGYIELPKQPKLPVGISFFSTANAEPVLIEAAYSYEQATQHRQPPQLNITASHAN
ncbi:MULTISPECIES: amidase [Idiomarina]|nr:MULTISPECIES: amidase [Idiomarina]MEC8926141.1 amidase [Pseudomonadota bacterium]